jgi:hypothetical protein
MMDVCVRSSRRWLLALMAVGIAAPVLAQQPPPFTHGDAAMGKTLSEPKCVACHERRFGDAATIYSRSERRVHSPEQLLAQIRICNAELGANYFPEEEEHIAAFLNSQYYKFPP